MRNVLISEPPVGDPLLSPNLIRSVLLTKPGTPYSEDQRDKDVDRLKDLYKQYDLQIGDFEAGIDQSSIDSKAAQPTCATRSRSCAWARSRSPATPSRMMT